MDCIIFKKLHDFRMDFNSLVALVDMASEIVFIKNLRIHIDNFNTVAINKVREELSEKTKYKLFDCDIFSSLSTYTGGTPYHVDEESVLILNIFGKVCYNMYRENIQSFLLEEGDAIYIPNGLPHSAIPLTPRISLSFRAET